MSSEVLKTKKDILLAGNMPIQEGVIVKSGLSNSGLAYIQMSNYNRPAEQTIVFTPGFNEFKETYVEWAKFLLFLSAKPIQVILVDLPGHGTSKRPDIITWDNLSRMYKEFIDEVSAKDLIVSGFSTGATINLATANRYNIQANAAAYIAPYCIPRGLTTEHLLDFIRHLDQLRKITTTFDLQNKGIAMSFNTLVDYVTMLLNSSSNIYNTIPSWVVLYNEDVILHQNTAEYLSQNLPNLQSVTSLNGSHTHDVLSTEEILSRLESLFPQIVQES